MSVEEIKRIARHLVEAASAGNLSVIDQYIAEDFVDHDAPPGLASGREGVKQIFAMMDQAFSDMRITFDHEIAEGDKLAQRSTTTATHTGEFMGIPATGKTITWTETHILRFAGGKIVEHWANMDELVIMQQLGVVPA